MSVKVVIIDIEILKAMELLYAAKVSTLDYGAYIEKRNKEAGV